MTAKDEAQEEVLQTRTVSVQEVRKDMDSWKQPFEEEYQTLCSTVIKPLTPSMLRQAMSSATHVLLQYYANTTLYYKVLLQYYSVLQSTTPTSETTSERRPSSTTPYYASTTKASKTSISCEASATFHRKSFQNDRFVRGFLQISQNKLPKRAFRAMLPTIFTEKASKRIVSCEASFKFHKTMLPKGAFCAMLPTIFTKNARFATVLWDRHTESYERVHPAKSTCASRYNGVPSKISKRTFRYSGVRKNV